ncbi:kinetochore protein Mis14 [Pseudozyma hubeiensis SY62]|uniref:Kinetochore protein Mis14 n=1 Tax=Pseudozyma hubeiensis (strain SY62) TaxID=1305764 RepID=R9P7W0_PSEHS|nr:kinetochore protein Mis14 [Pseudozyma hubeiensis SY62]GAC97446.1 kinetochore protein Mis14 [Pseudozyma hubeiensis SY62]
MEFGSELERDKALRAVVDKMLTRLTGATKAKIERNLLYNGMSPSEFARHSKGVEPFDEDLSRRLQVLNDQANTLTTEVIAFRKALPARRAEAMEKRSAVIRALEAKKEEHRRAAEKAHALELSEQSKPISIDLKRKAEVAVTLKHSVVDITSLQVVSGMKILFRLLDRTDLKLTSSVVSPVISHTVDLGASYSGHRASQARQAPAGDAVVSLAFGFFRHCPSVFCEETRLYPNECNAIRNTTSSIRVWRRHQIGSLNLLSWH